MDWTVGTFWTVGIDSRRIGLIGDRLDSWERRRPGGTGSRLFAIVDRWTRSPQAFPALSSA